MAVLVFVCLNTDQAQYFLGVVFVRLGRDIKALKTF